MMKKLLLMLLLAGTTCYAQTTDSDPPKNWTEFKVNLLSAGFRAIDFEFERTLSKRSSIGLSFFTNLLPLEKPGSIEPFSSNGLDYRNSVSLFYRHYLGKKYAQGFFLEGFAAYNNFERFVASSTPPNRTNGYENIHDMALGIGIGYKWISKKGLILQTNIGVGKNVFQPDAGEEFFPKLGISIGYRF
jgi:hypothetical protein